MTNDSGEDLREQEEVIKVTNLGLSNIDSSLHFR